MDQPASLTGHLPTEVIVTGSQRSLGNLLLDWMPQPGDYLEVEAQTYAVLERRHRYQLRFGIYYLAKIAIYVQPAQLPSERSLLEGRWVLGDGSCEFNARSELLRCAVLPDGPCRGCRFYQPR
jgi:hypothetical protein